MSRKSGEVSDGVLVEVEEVGLMFWGDVLGFARLSVHWEGISNWGVAVVDTVGT